MIDTNLEQQLSQVEQTCSVMARAVSAEDWETASQSDQELKRGLVEINELISAWPGGLNGAAREVTVARLTQLFESLEQMTSSLIEARDDVAGEIGTVKTGRQAALHYLDTADY